MSNYIGSSQEALDFLRSIAVRDRLIFELADALEWALEQVEDDLDLDHRAAVEAARKTLSKVKGETA
jgi:hypothetical protein